MTKRLTRTERESIIINHFKGKDTPGYEVSKLSNGKYKITKKPIEIEEEDEPEPKEPKEIEPKQIKQDVSETLNNISKAIEPEEIQQPKIKSYNRKRLVF